MRSSNAYVQLDPAVFEQARQMDLLVNKFPRNTELYKLMTTKFGEV